MKKIFLSILSVCFLLSCKNEEKIFIKNTNAFIRKNFKQKFNHYKSLETIALKNDITNASLLLKMDSSILSDFIPYDTSVGFKKFISKKIILKSNEMRNICPSILDEQIISNYDTINPKFSFKNLFDSTLSINKNVTKEDKLLPIMNVFKYNDLNGKYVNDTLYLFHSKTSIRLFGSGIKYQKGYNYLGSAGEFKRKNI